MHSFKTLSLRRFFKIRNEHRVDWINPVCIALLGIVGMFFIYSAQHYSGGSSWKMQGIWLCMGAIVYSAVAMINYKFFLEFGHIFYLIGILLLIPVAAMALQQDIGLGFELSLIPFRYGSYRWIDFGPFSIQPSDPAKIGTLILIASLLARSEVGTIKQSLAVLLKVGAAFLLPLLLIFLQPDLGSSLVFPPFVISLLYVSNLSKRFFAAAIGIFILVLVVVGMDIYRYQQYLVSEGIVAVENKGGYQSQSWIPLKDYQRNRILGFIPSEAAQKVIDPQGNGITWNLKQSLIAIASGGFFGKGFGEGTQAKLGYLPPTVAHNDFIFPVLAEESGFIGGIFVLLVFFIMIVNNIRIAGLARDRFGMLLAVGVSVIFMVHIFINIGMTIGLMPITGLPLPFLSYGGSFVLSCCILQGLVQSVYRHRKDFS